jgi:hypothetical protein
LTRDNTLDYSLSILLTEGRLPDDTWGGARASRFPALRSPHFLREREVAIPAYPAPVKEYGRFCTPGVSPRSLRGLTRQSITQRRRHNSHDLQIGNSSMDARVIGVLEERRSSNGYARA